jgi:hypothetical protein
VAKRKEFLVRLDPRVHDALRRWSDEDLRSLNAQVEFLLRRALERAGRLPRTQEAQEAREEKEEKEGEE